jgi:hypothetical protein
MLGLLLVDALCQTLQLIPRLLNLPPRRLALLVVHFHRRGIGQPPMGAAHNRRHHLQIA